MESENITYFVDDCNLDNSVELNLELAELLNDFEQIANANKTDLLNEDEIITEIQNYELNFTIKQLLVICDYYGLTKQTKNTRALKKSDIITLIMMFEKNAENIDIVMKRKELWFYLDSLKSDKIMKKFVIW
jgi:tRNA(Ile)-lysidine synthase TilS/MesJ